MTHRHTADFDYELPPDAIAQRPVERGRSRLLVLDAEGGDRHRSVADLPTLLRPGDLLVLNDTRVIAARLEARTESGGGLELLLLEPADGAPPEAARRWEVLVKPGRKARPGRVLRVGDLHLGVIEKLEDRYVVEFESPVLPRLDRIGHVPLPPYIARPDDPTDRERYQTVWAAVPGAIAAPTAGLHFDRELLTRLGEAGIGHTTVTLHVGLGTFRPVEAREPSRHRMHSERMTVSARTVLQIERARRAGGRIVAVGTTVVRALESAAVSGTLEPLVGRTELFITPGYRFRVVDVLLTNFHLPRSTLIMMVSALAGRRRVLEGYREAIARGYRFYSYGDAMLAERHPSGETDE